MGAIKEALLMMEELDELLGDNPVWVGTQFARAFLRDDLKLFTIQITLSDARNMGYELGATDALTGEGQISLGADLDDVEQFLVDNGFVGEE